MQPVHVGICVIWVAYQVRDLWPNTDLWTLTSTTKDMETVSIAFKSPALSEQAHDSFLVHSPLVESHWSAVHQ